jgi:hypothetical protein
MDGDHSLALIKEISKNIFNLSKSLNENSDHFSVYQKSTLENLLATLPVKLHSLEQNGDSYSGNMWGEIIRDAKVVLDILKTILGIQLSPDTHSNIPASTFKPKFCHNCGSKVGPDAVTYCTSCGSNFIEQMGQNNGNIRSINITGTQGDVIGVDIQGDANVFGKNIAVEDNLEQNISLETTGPGGGGTTLTGTDVTGVAGPSTAPRPTTGPGGGGTTLTGTDVTGVAGPSTAPRPTTGPNYPNIDIVGMTSDVIGVGSSNIGDILPKAYVSAPPDIDFPSTKPEKLVIERYPYARFPDKIVLGDIMPLEIIINAVKPPSYNKAQTSIALTTSHVNDEIPVVVTLEWTNGFDLEGERYYATIHVPFEPENSKPVIFNLKAKEEGEQTIVIRFYQQQSYVGQIKINSLVVHSRDELQVKSAISSPQSVVWTSNKLPEKALQGPDITIYIQERKVSPNFEFGVLISSPEFPIREMGPIKLPFNPETKFHMIFEDIENINLPPEVVDTKIKNKGITLYDDLFPESLKKLYWEKRDKIKSIRILSKEPWIPWEIIKPWHELENGDIEEDEFLCEKYAFSRWIVDVPERIKEKIYKMKVIVPSDTNLDWALEERDWIREFGNSRQRDVSFDTTYQQVLNTFQTGELDLLHFSTHGQSNKENPLFSFIELDDGIQLRPEDISGGARKFGRSSPVVVMNACQTGNQGFSLTGVQGWATKFLGAGASVFVGTLWSVSDEIAFKFVKELYSELSSGTALGEAVRKARNKCKQSGDPSWLAYQVYGHPNAEIKFGT